MWGDLERTLCVMYPVTPHFLLESVFTWQLQAYICNSQILNIMLNKKGLPGSEANPFVEVKILVFEMALYKNIFASGNVQPLCQVLWLKMQDAPHLYYRRCCSESISIATCVYAGWLACHQHWMSAIVCWSYIFLFTVSWMSLCLCQCPANYSPSTVSVNFGPVCIRFFFSSSSKVMIFDEVINMTILTVPTFRWWVSINIPLLSSSWVQGYALAFYTFNCVIVMAVNTALPFSIKCPVMGILAPVATGSTRTHTRMISHQQFYFTSVCCNYASVCAFHYPFHLEWNWPLFSMQFDGFCWVWTGGHTGTILIFRCYFSYS